jgi:hypothetical protein
MRHGLNRLIAQDNPAVLIGGGPHAQIYRHEGNAMMKVALVPLAALAFTLSSPVCAQVRITGSNDQAAHLKGAAANAAVGAGTRADLDVAANNGAVRIIGNNKQQASIAGGVVNAAVGAGAVAKTRIASNAGAVAHIGGNSQTVTVQGAVVTTALPGTYATTDIGSATVLAGGGKNNQSVSVGGVVANVAAVPGTVSTVKIGSK